jgi:hypothetical protein
MDIAKTLGSLSNKEKAAIAVSGLGIGYIWRKRAKASSVTSPTVTASGGTLASGSGLLDGTVSGSSIGGDSGSSTVGGTTNTPIGGTTDTPTVPDVPNNPGSIPLPTVTWTVTIGGQQYETDGTSYWPIGTPVAGSGSGNVFRTPSQAAAPAIRNIINPVGTAYAHLKDNTPELGIPVGPPQIVGPKFPNIAQILKPTPKPVPKLAPKVVKPANTSVSSISTTVNRY